MLLLAADTSGKHGSIALANCDASGCNVIEVVPLEGGTFSAQLVPQIKTLLQKHHLSKEHIDGFAVVSGPGSFTGLRVGLAVIKGLAEVLKKPIAAVSILEAVALSGTTDGRVFAALDAGRNQAFLGEYQLASSEARMLSERLVSFEELPADAIRMLTPDANVASAAKLKNIPVEQVVRPDAGTIARLEWKTLAAGVRVAPEDLEANYIRRSDAEFLKSNS